MNLSMNHGISDSTPILHHYDFSPFAEKIRLAFGLKKLAWRSVIAPSVMPKPDLVALTGGYRNIPVLQIGADVYCDTRRIARELDRRFPERPLVQPETNGIATAIEAWAERDLFWPIVRYVSGVNAERLDPQLHIDRAALRGKHPPSIERLKQVARRNLAYVRPQIPIVDSLLVTGRPYLASEQPGLADISVYHALWFLSAFEIDLSGELDAYPRIRTWMERVAQLGHGEAQDMSPAATLQVARQCEPIELGVSTHDDSLPPLGAPVTIGPDEYSTSTVTGTLAYVDGQDLAINRADPDLGAMRTHYPRIGYTVRAIAE